VRRTGLAIAALLVTATTGCSAEVVDPTSPAPTPSASPTATASPLATPSPTPSPSGIELPTAGTPFDAVAVLAAMRDSRRPGGVPDQLETEPIAAAVAAAVVTFDGLPWTTMAASGSCGPDSCTLELAGTRPDSHGDDLWIFDVRPADGSVAVTTAELRGLPNAMLPAIDGLARSLLPAATLDGLLLTSARWLPPPHVGQFVLSYRGDGEEGSCGLVVWLDAVTTRLVGDPSPTC
jgi:hypothetical protein